MTTTSRPRYVHLDADKLAEVTDCVIYLFGPHVMAAARSDLATEYLEAGLSVTYVARPRVQEVITSDPHR